MVNVLMELIDRFIEFILQRLPDKASDNEKHRYVIKMMIISFAVLLWGLIALTIANVDLKRDNYALNRSVSKVNTLLDVNSPDSPLNSLLLLNNESLVKLQKVKRENDRLGVEVTRLTMSTIRLKEYLKQCTLQGVGEWNNPYEEPPVDPKQFQIVPPVKGIKEDEVLTDANK